ncbi:MAG: patatin-like phospholipase family protein [Pseudomonadales bacterium]|nr:patatin-like phospholipase family protein [Pseudomonadales bacterium]
MSKTGLILSGGGARASYQVGVLRAVAEIVEDKQHNPFDVISGTSAGGINAASLACRSDDFGSAVERLWMLWENLTSADVHRTGYRELLKATLNLLFSFFSRGAPPSGRLFLLNNSPLRTLLQRTIDLERIDARIESGDIYALGISALEYFSGNTIHFFQAHPDVEAWQRQRRIGIRTRITHAHLMASAAIPGIYSSVKIGRSHYGDGALRDTAPMSAALHMGADRLFVIGSSHNPRENGSMPPIESDHSPSVAQIISHLFNRSFLDTLEEDVERLERLNEVVERLSESDREELGIKPVEVMCVIPGMRVDELAARHFSSLPASLRTFFRTVGANGESGGAGVAS